jgi:hypothetical protein
VATELSVYNDQEEYKMSIDLSVSLYSFSINFFNKTYDLEMCIKKAAGMGYKGVEIVAAQMIPDYPNPSKEWCDWFSGLLKKYNMLPLCYSAYIDMGLHTGRNLSEEEIIQWTLNDIMYASYLNFPIVRTQHAISPKILEKMIPYAKKWHVWLGVELHAPHNLRVDVWQQYIKLFERVGSEYIGVVPDMGIFQEHPHVLFKRAALEKGISRSRLNQMVSSFEDGKSEAETSNVLAPLDDNEKQVISGLYGTFHKAKLEDLESLIPYSRYMHGKFYYIDEKKTDSCIPYEAIIKTLKKCQYNGHIAAEYEGHFTDGSIDCVEQLQRFSDMVRKIL